MCNWFFAGLLLCLSGKDESLVVMLLINVDTPVHVPSRPLHHLIKSSLTAGITEHGDSEAVDSGGACLFGSSAPRPSVLRAVHVVLWLAYLPDKRALL